MGDWLVKIKGVTCPEPGQHRKCLRLQLEWPQEQDHKSSWEDALGFEHTIKDVGLLASKLQDVTTEDEAKRRSASIDAATLTLSSITERFKSALGDSFTFPICITRDVISKLTDSMKKIEVYGIEASLGALDKGPRPMPAYTIADYVNDANTASGMLKKRSRSTTMLLVELLLGRFLLLNGKWPCVYTPADPSVPRSYGRVQMLSPMIFMGQVHWIDSLTLGVYDHGGVLVTKRIVESNMEVNKLIFTDASAEMLRAALVQMQ